MARMWCFGKESLDHYIFTPCGLSDPHAITVKMRQTGPSKTKRENQDDSIMGASAFTHEEASS